MKSKDSFEYLDLSPRFKNVLLKNGIDSIEALEPYSLKDLSYLNNISTEMIEDLIRLTNKKPLSVLNLKPGFITVLNKHGIYSVESLATFSSEELNTLKGIGEKTLYAIEMALLDYYEQLSYNNYDYDDDDDDYTYKNNLQSYCNTPYSNVDGLYSTVPTVENYKEKLV